MEETKSIWNKQMQELTVKENLKVAAAFVVVGTALSVAPLVIFVGVDKLREVRRNRRFNKEVKEMANN